MKIDKSIVITNTIILLLLGTFIFIAGYSRPPVGDDVLCQISSHGYGIRISHDGR